MRQKEGKGGKEREGKEGEEEGKEEEEEGKKRREKEVGERGNSGKNLQKKKQVPTLRFGDRQIYQVAGS